MLLGLSCQVCCHSTVRPHVKVLFTGLHVGSERSPRLPEGWFNWIRPFWKIPDSYVLNHSSIDGYLFLRFLKVLIVIYFVGCCTVVPILVPIHAYGGLGQTELDKLSFGNIANGIWYYAHAGVGWFYLGKCTSQVRYTACLTLA